MALCAERRREILERLAHAMRRLVEDERARLAHELLQHALGDRDDPLARLGHRHEPLAAALEDVHAEFELELPDLLRHPRLGGEERIRRPGQVESLPDRLPDVAELLEVHLCGPL